MSFGAPAWFWGLLLVPFCALLFFAQNGARHCACMNLFRLVCFRGWRER